MTLIDRAFRRLTAGQVHYREAGAVAGRTPLLMLHGGPGSSASLVPLMTALSRGRRVVAPDLMGNGDSDPLPSGRVTIEAHAACMIELLDALRLDRVDLYGHHGGAQVACEIAIARPGRVRRLVLNGLALFASHERAEFAARYAPPIEPTADGAHLSWAWEFAVNLTRYFPYYRRDEAHRIEPPMVMPADSVTRLVVDMLKAWPTYHRLYDAAFAHDLAARLPMVTACTLVLGVEGDPLAKYAPSAAGMLAASRIAMIARDAVGETIGSFLDSEAEVDKKQVSAAAT